MKKLLPILLAIILTVIIFTGCNPLFPLDKDQFDFNDTLTISIGEKLYENEYLWIRLDSISEDSRCPEGAFCIWPGRVVLHFTFSTYDSLHSVTYSTENEHGMIIYYTDSPISWMEDLTLLVIDVLPNRVLGETILPEDYRVDLKLICPMSVDRKPNIYLYPHKKTKMDVSLGFPHGGKVIESDPFYPLQWKDIKVKPNGKIDNKFDFLFYECEIPDFWQYSEGWVVKQENLSDFFAQNLKDYGFNENEIEDFLEFWIPELKDAPNYEIYPQYTEMVNQVIKLKISPYPDAKLRLHYVIKRSDKYVDLPVPEIPDFDRHGFTVTEWGVILK